MPDRRVASDPWGRCYLDCADYPRCACGRLDDLEYDLSPHDPKDVRPNCPCQLCSLVRRTVATFGSAQR